MFLIKKFISPLPPSSLPIKFVVSNQGFLIQFHIQFFNSGFRFYMLPKT